MSVIRNILRNIRHRLCWLTVGHRWVKYKGSDWDYCNRCGRTRSSWKRGDRILKAAK